MESEDGTGSRHAHAVFKEMWIATHLFHFAVRRVTLVIRFFVSFSYSHGNDATCKRLTKYAGYITLSSLNQKYEPIMFSNEDIINKPVRIIGKVVELRGKL